MRIDPSGGEVTVFDDFAGALARERHGDHELYAEASGGSEGLAQLGSPMVVLSAVCVKCGASTSRAVRLDMRIEAWQAEAVMAEFRDRFPPSCDETAKILEVAEVMEE